MQSGAIRLARDALATRDLRRLQLANVATGIGGWAFMVSLAVHAYAVGGAAAVGLAALVRMAPAGLAAPLTGLAADRFPRRDVLLASVLARALLLAAAAWLVAFDAPFPLLLVLATLFTVAATAHKPAQAALLPSLAPSKTRQAASNALWTAIDNGAFVAGAVAGGVLVAAAGPAAAFGAAALAFVAATAALSRVAREQGSSYTARLTLLSTHTAPAAEARGSDTAPAAEARGWDAAPADDPRGWDTAPAAEARGWDKAPADDPRGWDTAPAAEARGWDAAPADEPRARASAPPRRLVAVAAHDALAGVRVVARDRRLRLLVGVLSASTLVEGMVDVLVVVTALNLVDLGDAGVGWLNAAWGIGGIAGGAFALRLLATGRLGTSIPLGGILIGAPLIALAVLPSPAFALAALLILGVGYALVESAGITLLQRIAHDRVRARAFGVIESSYWLTTGAGAMLAPAIIALTSPRAALAIVGAALPILVLARATALTKLPDAPAPARIAAPAVATPHSEPRELEPVL